MLLTALGVVCLLAASLMLARPAQPSNPAKVQGHASPREVRVVVAAQSDSVEMVLAVGTLEARREVIISADIPGRVEAIRFESGAHVEAGQILAELDTSVERAQLIRYRAQAELAKADLERDQKLVNNGYVTKRTIEQEVERYAEARSQISSVEATIQLKTIRAPFSGSLGIRQIDVGSYLAAGGRIVSLSDGTEMMVNFSIPERYFSGISVGQKVDLRLSAYPDVAFRASVTAIDARVNLQTRCFFIQATFDKPEKPLLPGMYAEARIGLLNKEKVVMIPESAIDFSLLGDSVAVAERNQDRSAAEGFKARRANVVVGSRHSGLAEVTSGIEPGMLVLTYSQPFVRDGVSLTPKVEELTMEPANSSPY